MIKTRYLKNRLLIGVIIFIIMILSIIIYIITPRGTPLQFSESKLDYFYQNLQDGDIICRLGDRLWSQFFSNVSIEDKRFSHVGVIRISDGNITVIHAEGTTKPGKDYVKEETLEDFIKIARSIGIYRIEEINGSQISNMAIEYIGLPFDWKFDLDDESELFCTELIYIILNRIIPTYKLDTIYIKELGKEIIPIEAISNSIYFSEIYFMDNIND